MTSLLCASRYGGRNTCDQFRNHPLAFIRLYGFVDMLDPKHCVTLTVLFPPSSNRYWRVGRNGQVYVSSIAKKYIEDMRVDLAMNGYHFPVMQNKIGMMCLFRPPTRTGKRYDIDNRFKVMVDALEAAHVIRNDRDIDYIAGFRGPISRTQPPPGVDIVMWDILEDESVSLWHSEMRRLGIEGDSNERSVSPMAVAQLQRAR